MLFADCFYCFCFYFYSLNIKANLFAFCIDKVKLNNAMSLNAKELISSLVLPLRTSDTASTALTWMEELRVSHLPIVNNESFLGLVSDVDIYAINDPDEPLGNHHLSLKRPYVYAHQHYYEVIRLASNEKLSLVPVLDERGNYQGCISLQSLVNQMAGLVSVNQPGGIIVLEMNVNDYSLSEIGRIVEGNDARILSAYITSHSDSTKLEVTLKLNKIDISGVLQTFNRYNYTVKAFYSEESKWDDLLNDRFDGLMTYLNI